MEVHLQEVLAATSCGTFLAIAVLIAIRRQTSPIALSLGLTTLLLAGYCFADVVEEFHHRDTWHRIEYAFASAAAIPFVALMAQFLGIHRRFRWVLGVAYTYFAVLAILCLAPFLTSIPIDFGGSPNWALLMLGGLLPYVTWLGLRVVHHSQNSLAEERARALLLMAAVLFGIGGVAMDLITISRGEGPKISAIGLAISGLVLALVVIRSGLFEKIDTTALVGSGLVAALAAGLLIIATPISTGFEWMVIFIACFLLIGGVVIVRPLLSALIESRARRRQLAMMGSFADQLTHDLLNPLATIKGAAQLLLEQRHTSQTISDEYLELIVNKSDELERSVRNFERLGRAEIGTRSDIHLSTLLEGFAEAQRLALGADIEIVLETDAQPVRLRIDPELLTVAFSNLAKNAREAMPKGGRLTIETRIINGPLGDRAQVTFTDTGLGIDVRHLERIFDPGFSTKPGGRGRGLPYVREIIQAHGGRISVESIPQRGAIFRVDLPATPLTSPGSRSSA